MCVHLPLFPSLPLRLSVYCVVCSVYMPDVCSPLGGISVEVMVDATLLFGRRHIFALGQSKVVGTVHGVCAMCVHVMEMRRSYFFGRLAFDVTF